MITGKIITYKTEPQVYKYQYQGESDWYEHGHFNSMPPFHRQGDILKEMLDEAYRDGFVIGARVRRKTPINSLSEGTITHIHEAFGMAWNYTTGVLEPIKVQWDTKDNKASCFDYSPEELILIKDESTPVITNHETVSNLHQSC